MSKHTPEPWAIGASLDIYSTAPNALKYDIAHCYRGEWKDEEREANAKRIVSCVNACAKINPEAVPDLFTALQSAAIVLYCAGGGDGIKNTWWPELQQVRSALKKATIPLDSDPPEALRCARAGTDSNQSQDGAPRAYCHPGITAPTYTSKNHDS